jgi:hypothetical protein
MQVKSHFPLSFHFHVSATTKTDTAEICTMEENPPVAMQILTPPGCNVMLFRRKKRCATREVYGYCLSRHPSVKNVVSRDEKYNFRPWRTFLPARICKV